MIRKEKIKREKEKKTQKEVVIIKTGLFDELRIFEGLKEAELALYRYSTLFGKSFWKLNGSFLAPLAGCHSTHPPQQPPILQSPKLYF